MDEIVRQQMVASNVAPENMNPSRLSSPGVAEVREISQERYNPTAASSVPLDLRSRLQVQLQQPRYSPHPHQGEYMSSGPQQYHGSSFMNMNALGNALPDPRYANYSQQAEQSPQFASIPSTNYHVQGGGQFQNQNPHYASQYQGIFGPQQGQRNGMLPQSLPHQPYFSQPNYASQQPQLQHASPFFYHQGSFTQPQQYVHGSHTQPQFGATGYAVDNVVNGQLRTTETSGFVGGVDAGTSSHASSMGQSSVTRGPPRKPKQSGHALWVGNLPPTANVVDLKDHFSRDATDVILSVFLISKSNCAFVNYKTEESCASAMSRFHDSRFQQTRLVCRLRRAQVTAVAGAPSGPSANMGTSSSEDVVGSKPRAHVIDGDVSGSDTKLGDLPTPTDRYFIVKSLTVEDLEMSVRSGQWATQSHNENVLNKAYQAAESVFLVFSANKSGEYFGYARMTSPIDEDPAAAIEFAPKAQFVEDPDLPKAIPTPATEYAPKGRIIDDSARGTIFWEAERGDEDETKTDESDQVDEDDAEGDAKAWGKPFKIQWLSTNRLPFYRTRGLRNPWNSNREVKIARDGTELETTIGRRLVQMFHRESAPASVPLPLPHLGYSAMRQY